MDNELINDETEFNENENENIETTLNKDASIASEIPNFDKVENYYLLKNVYDENKKTQKERAFLDLDKNNNKNWKLKQSLFNKSKPKCVNCKRNVGTIFLNSYNKENKNRILIAKCGDQNAPCELNIELVLNPVSLLDEKVRADKKEMSLNQDKIIRTKNDLLFGYLPEEEALNFFETITTDIETNTKNVEINLYKFLNITHNTKQKEKIKELKNQFYENIKEFKGFITNFEKDKNLKHIKNANEYYEHNILPTIKELNELKFAYANVDHNYDNNTKQLIQKEYTKNMIEDLNGKEMVEVIHYNIGNDDNSNQESQIEKDTQQIIPSLVPEKRVKTSRKPKQATTVKINPSIEIQGTKTRKNKKSLSEAPKLMMSEPLDNATIFRAIDEMKSNISPNELGEMSLRQFIERLENEYGFNNLLNTHKKAIKNYLIAPEFEIEPQK